VLDVRDDFCAWNAGVWRLRAVADDVTCERTSAEPDVALGVRELGAAYLGGTSLQSLAAAGLVHELVPGALGAAVGRLPARAGAVVPEIF
jgi:hypothetical protein